MFPWQLNPLAKRLIDSIITATVSLVILLASPFPFSEISILRYDRRKETERRITMTKTLFSYEIKTTEKQTFINLDHFFA